MNEECAYWERGKKSNSLLIHNEFVSGVYEGIMETMMDIEMGTEKGQSISKENILTLQEDNIKKTKSKRK